MQAKDALVNKDPEKAIEWLLKRENFLLKDDYKTTVSLRTVMAKIVNYISICHPLLGYYIWD